MCTFHLALCTVHYIMEQISSKLILVTWEIYADTCIYKQSERVLKFEKKKGFKHG